MTAHEEIASLGLNPTAFIALPAVLLALSTICLALRIYVRSSMIKAWGLDDTFLVITFVSVHVHQKAISLTTQILFVADAAVFITIGRIELEFGLLEKIEDVVSVCPCSLDRAQPY